MNNFIIMYYDLILNTELNKITLQLSNEARYPVINEFWKLPK